MIKRRKIQKKNYSEKGNVILSKRKATNLIRYGTEAASSSSTVKERVKGTNFERYGTETTLELNQVRTARVNVLKRNKEEINQKRRESWTKEKIIITQEKRVKTLQKNLVLIM